MRITSEVMVTRSLDRLQTRLQAYERSQSELATGKRILRPSDDPDGARRAMSLRASMESRQQELRNANDAEGWLNATDGQLQSGLSRLARVRDLSVSAATLQDRGQKSAIATEIRAIAEELVGIANTRHMGRPLFGGFSAGDAVTVTQDPFGVTFDPEAGQADAVKRRVSDTEQVRVNVTAAEWLGAVPGTDGEDLISFLHGLAADVDAGDQEAVSSKLAGLDQARDTMSASLADIGAAGNRVTSAKARAEDSLLTMRTELSNVQDVDIAQGMMELQIQEIGYQATLHALSQALPPSLVSFLR
jgi:flagellar hook-associated protein 3 FlgL